MGKKMARKKFIIILILLIPVFIFAWYFSGKNKEVYGEQNFTYFFAQDLRLGMKNKDVEALQQALSLEGCFNYSQYTDYYGFITQEAVNCFQQKYASEILAPFNLTSPTNYFGSSSRAKMNKLYSQPPVIEPFLGESSINYWSSIGNNIYNANSGNVGIGTTNPSALLNVYDAASTGNTALARFFQPSIAAGNYSFISTGSGTGAANNVSMGFVENATDANTYGFLSIAGDNPTVGTGLILRKGGNVGIGTTSPSEALELASSKNIRLSDNTQIQLGSAVTDNSSVSSRLSLQRLETVGTFPGRGPGGAAATGLYLQIPQPNARVLGLMIGPEPSPVGRSDGGAPFALLVNGDMLIGDIFTISSATISAFARQTTQTAVIGTVLMSNTSTITDGTGGASITLDSDANPAGVNNNAGSLFLTAFGRGTGSLANSIIFQTRSAANSVTARAVLDGNGNLALGIGATDNARFHAYNNSSTALNVGEFEAAVTGYTGTSLIASNTLGAASTYNLFSAITDSDGDQGGSVTQFLIRGDGRVGIGTANPGNILTVAQGSATDPVADAWTVYSSARWKENVNPLSGALEKINLLNPVYFDWKKGYGAGHDLGFIAEEVGKVVPELVAWEENGINAKSLDYGRLSALAIAGIKEQQKQIENLNLKISDLEARMNNFGRLTSEDSSSLSTLFLDWLKDKVMAVKELVADKLTAKKAVLDALEMRDKNTNQIYCVTIENGVLKSILGEC